MLMKVFPHGTGEGDKPSRYLVRPDYPGRDTAPPQILRGDLAMTRALIDSIERRWKFTSGALSWHPNDKVSEEQEEEVMDAFERVAFAGLEADQRNILWVRHTHAGHHELHFLIPRLELSSGKDFNACPPGWQKDFDVFRDLFNWREGWARPDDPARARDELPKKADLFKARMAKWGKEIRESDRDRAKEVIHAFLKEKVTRGLVRNREDILSALKEQGLSINREGRDYISVIAPNSGMKMRFRGGFYARDWTPKTAPPKVITEEESEEKKRKRRGVWSPACNRLLSASLKSARPATSNAIRQNGNSSLTRKLFFCPGFRRIPFMTETERMLTQSLKRMEENCNARLTALGTRLDMQEDKQMLMQAELRTLKLLFNDVSEVYSSLQTLLTTLKNGA